MPYTIRVSKVFCSFDLHWKSCFSFVNEKLLGILSYLGILSLIPYFCGDKSEFVKYHATQGLNLFLVSIVYFVLNHLLSLIKITKTVVSFNGVVGT